MYKKRKWGYISIEAVITATLILSVGFFALFNLSGTGSRIVQNGLARLDDTGVFAGASGVVDENGYPDELNIASGDINPEDDFEYFWDETHNGWTISAYLNSTDLDVVIPKTRASDGLPIVGINNNTFGNMGLTSVALPNSLVWIGPDSFQYNSLTSLIIPESVVEIGNYAFENNQLVSIAIPENVSQMGTYVFFHNQLTNFKIPSVWTKIPNGTFSTNQLKTVVIPNTIKEVGTQAFSHNQIDTLVLPEGLTTIFANAFLDNKLTELTIPGTVTTIWEAAFNWNLLVGDEAFIYKSATDTTTVVSYGGASKDIIIPEGVTHIGYIAFSFLELNSVVLPNSLVDIGTNAFADNNLTSLIIPSNVTTAGWDTFANNYTLSSVQFNRGPLVSAGGGMFKNSALSDASVRVPSAHLSSFQSRAFVYGLSSSSVFVGY